MPPPEKKPKLTEGERVFCYHGPLLYEAKVIKSQVKEKTVKYLVHYAGWNVKWDEWVAESRVLKYSEETVKKQKELKQQHQQNRKDKKKNQKDDKKEADSPSAIKRKKPRPTVVSDKAPSCTRRADVKIDIPQELRRFLLDDCDFVTRQKQLVPLPKVSHLTVRGICSNYIKQTILEQGKQPTLESTLQEISNGICEYFNVMLGSHLLYRFERLQYAEILRTYPDKQLCEIYGSEHLLRLFVKLGSVLTSGSLDEASAEYIVVHIHDLLAFMAKGADELFSPEYETATPDYHRNFTS